MPPAPDALHPAAFYTWYPSGMPHIAAQPQNLAWKGSDRPSQHKGSLAEEGAAAQESPGQGLEVEMGWNPAACPGQGLEVERGSKPGSALGQGWEFEEGSKLDAIQQVLVQDWGPAEG